MIKELYRLRLIILLAFVAVLMGLTRWKYKNYQWPEAEVAIQISPTSMPTPTSKPTNEELYPLYNLLPFKGKDFVVDSYLTPFVLNVITAGNIKTVTKDIYKWMIENKVATESHKLIFSDK
ncbi:hypothetical protein CO009_03975 [Candidatus Shapirobacteria bacterium CG_4_8_14_3_um_filter_35_11]|uniref:Uncharacterized protein n=5 Tax=Candidatus Shapironibacteriota TaxID=1752721 RepID=A0A1J5HP52_9BACT|nr:MAG: hypothetical protein AUK05_02615 [Candidatus Shapirobacteria bacterium CG2_30_35_20]PIV07606.1 MAG: hypothetical protein COS53_01510 [Candidatus Shapirobacteria bacterium CG03_land_8_20_14_0_80_35_14]PIX67794.1 MAG: hypothetical protein COZ41_03075 [Candidatus Shapirobacteria bacterium CG_4_10_14_3_um_filter_35_13]PJC79679.1 MAG: hypothetical protein CO009_03975 [Candidatus Shapirobacteria bacterium CG_4_8_14_3_um_filter_35_11]PJE66748.1 MAG: hypothetical protein COU93_02605 [Candidatus